jgi:hypothetical protein
MNTSVRFLILMISVLLLSSCCQKGQNEPGNRSADSLRVQIGRFLDEWHNAASRADLQAYFEKIDEQGIYIGTDATEHWAKQAFYDWSKPYFDKGKAWSFQAEERNIYLSEDQKIAWFDEKLSSASGPLRGSGVLIHKNGEWKIVNYVLSLPVPNEKFPEVLELIGEK